MTTRSLRPPSSFLTLTEGFRARAEFASLGLSAWLLMQAPRGDGHPVVVLPGFMADDDSTSILRAFLDHLGYKTYGWGLGKNLGPASFHPEEDLGARLREILEEHQEPVSLVGQSLGGVYAREIAKHSPDFVRQIITLGSPLRGQGGSVSYVEAMFNEMNSDHPDLHLSNGADLHKNPAVPSTSVYSQWDGIVAWENSIQDYEHHIENVHVYSSHMGMGVNPTVMYVVADRLAQSVGEWKPFEAHFHLGHLFPKNAH